MTGPFDRLTPRIMLVFVLGLLSAEACVDTVSIEGLSCDGAHACGDGLACVEGRCRKPRATPGIGCSVQADCPVGACLQEAGVCVACVVDTDCIAGVCLDDAYVCVSCRAHADCATRRCDLTTNTCLSCKSDAQCESGFCDEGTGVCAPPKSLEEGAVLRGKQPT